MTATIRNPVLSGFHPDPSILRVGSDYYLATSTFEWMPGVTLHHSTDLVHWEPLGGALGTTRLLDVVGTVDSGGVWAPCLSYADGLFHLVYTHMVHNIGPYRDLRNYVVTSPSPTGPWSDPVPLHNRGFDPSFFHEDGRTWLLAMEYDHRPGRDSFAGITLQEWSRAERRLVGPIRRILDGTGRGCTEGPHLYHRDGWYLLLVADGGTGADHGAAVARSRTLQGPYELRPEPVLTTRDDERHPLQKAGHGCLVETPDGEWFMAHLCSRPLPGTRRSVLGRETALLRVEWTDDGWPAVPGGRPALTVPAPAAARAAGAEKQPQAERQPQAEKQPQAEEQPGPYRFREDFDGRHGLDPRLLTLRLHPDPGWLSLDARPGHLRLRGQESLASPYRQSLVAHRQTSPACTATTVVDFRPSTPQQMAGLTHFYNTKLWHYLHLTWDEVHGRVLRLGSLDFQTYTESVTVPVPGDDPVYLRAQVDGPALRFSWSLDPSPERSPDGDKWEPVGPVLDASVLSDEYATRTADNRIINWGFTGAVLGLAAQDLTGSGLSADFDFFTYFERFDRFERRE